VYVYLHLNRKVARCVVRLQQAAVELSSCQRVVLEASFTAHELN